MKNTYIILSTNILCLFFLFTTCSCKKADDFIRLGSFGGFTGAETAFTVSPSGKVILENFTTKDGQSELKLKKTLIKSIFNQVSSENLLDIQYDNPGNMSNFIEINVKDKKNKIVWAVEDDSVPSSAKTIFDELNNAIRKQANE